MRTATALEAVRARRAYEAYMLLRWAAGKPVDKAAKALLVPVRVKV